MKHCFGLPVHTLENYLLQILGLGVYGAGLMVVGCRQTLEIDINSTRFLNGATTGAWPLGVRYRNYSFFRSLRDDCERVQQRYGFNSAECEMLRMFTLGRRHMWTRRLNSLEIF